MVFASPNEQSCNQHVPYNCYPFSNRRKGNNLKRRRCFTYPMALPLDVLEKSLNQKLSLLLKDGRLVEGKLTGYDEYMNMVLTDVEETLEENKRRLGTIILRGNNVVSISLL
jgi:small nuclear ribonucleoprotein